MQRSHIIHISLALVLGIAIGGYAVRNSPSLQADTPIVSKKAVIKKLTTATECKELELVLKAIDAYKAELEKKLDNPETSEEPEILPLTITASHTRSN